MRPAPPDGVEDRAWSGLFGPPIAHRGLWRAGGAPENSLAAFQAAARAGYGVELDVQRSADGEAVVFHDDRLDQRLTTAEGRVTDHTAAELARVRLGDSDQTISTLAQALDRVAGRALVLIELKVLSGDEGPLEARVADVLDAYAGPTAVIGFNPHALARFAALRPQTLRGLNSSAYADALNWALTSEQRRSLAALDHVAIARPHFLRLGVDMLPSAPAAAFRARGLPVAAWTVRSPCQADRVRPYCDTLMFEGFTPEVGPA